MPNEGVGSLAWARRTRGRLGRRDRAELIAQGVRRQARMLLPGLRGRAAATLDVDGYRPPDSAACREADELCREAASSAIDQHSHRVNLWGVVIARHERLDLDEEAHYVASLTHDLGLTERFRGHEPDAGCFSVDSAAACRDLVGRHGWERGRSVRAQESITFHLNAAVPLARGAEAYLLQVAAALDVTGYRFGEVARTTREEILARHPRHGMKAEFTALMH